MNLNKVFIIGRVTAAPLLKATPSGTAVTSFSVATNRFRKDKTGARQEETEFHNIVAWGRQAEVASQFLTKGAMVYVEGRLQTRSWQDKQNQSHKTTEIVCENLQLGPRPMGGGQGGPAREKVAQPASAAESGSDEINAPVEEIPVIDIEDDIKPEDLPF